MVSPNLEFSYSELKTSGGVFYSVFEITRLFLVGLIHPLRIFNYIWQYQKYAISCGFTHMVNFLMVLRFIHMVLSCDNGNRERLLEDFMTVRFCPCTVFLFCQCSCCVILNHACTFSFLWYCLEPCMRLFFLVILPIVVQHYVCIVTKRSVAIRSCTALIYLYIY